MDTLEQLKQTRSELVAKLRSVRTIEQDEAIIEQLNDNEKQITQVKRLQILANVNREQSKLRELAAQVWECEQPDADITTNDGSFHAVKVRKYPKLAALKYARAKFEDGVMTQLTADGHRFYMVTSKHEWNQPTVYARFESFAAFLDFNSIMPEELTIEQYNQLADDCQRINAEFSEQVKQFSAKKDALNLSAFAHYGLLDHENAGHVYKYSAKS